MSTRARTKSSLKEAFSKYCASMQNRSDMKSIQVHIWEGFDNVWAYFQQSWTRFDRTWGDFGQIQTGFDEIWGVFHQLVHVDQPFRANLEPSRPNWGFVWQRLGWFRPMLGRFALMRRILDQSWAVFRQSRAEP